MPELPEVETVVRGLAPVLPGRAFTRIEVERADVLRNPPDHFARQLVGVTVDAVARRGKNIVISTRGGVRLLVNLGMTGRLLLEGDRSGPAPPITHVCVRFELTGPTALIYADVRRFGALETLDPSAWEQRDGGLGPEPLDAGFGVDEFHTALARSRAPIRSWLLDQRKLAGIGNIYANEALFRAGIHPAAPARSIDWNSSARLLEALRRVLEAAIAVGGTTLRDYRQADGSRGEFDRLLQVYGRAGEPCIMCSTPVRRTVISGRSAFHCPACQPLPKGRPADPRRSPTANPSGSRRSRR